jgi:hypothetical protein
MVHDIVLLRCEEVQNWEVFKQLQKGFRVLDIVNLLALRGSWGSKVTYCSRTRHVAKRREWMEELSWKDKNEC